MQSAALVRDAQMRTGTRSIPGRRPSRDRADFTPSSVSTALEGLMSSRRRQVATGPRKLATNRASSRQGPLSAPRSPCPDGARVAVGSLPGVLLAAPVPEEHPPSPMGRPPGRRHGLRAQAGGCSSLRSRHERAPRHGAGLGPQRAGLALIRTTPFESRLLDPKELQTKVRSEGPSLQ